MHYGGRGTGIAALKRRQDRELENDQDRHANCRARARAHGKSEPLERVCDGRVRARTLHPRSRAGLVARVPHTHV